MSDLVAYSEWVSLLGVGLGLLGFCLIAGDLRKAPDDRAMWGSKIQTRGFYVVITGFVAQFIAQIGALSG